VTLEGSGVLKCDSGHERMIHLFESGWAILYERALQRHAAGQYRDAVLDAFTALEMYCAEVPARYRYDHEKDAEAAALLEETKPCVRTSERAYGAAFAVASVVSEEPPPRHWSKLHETRNNATHAGLYPTEADSLHVCDDVFRVVARLEGMLTKVSTIRSMSFAEALMHHRAHKAWEKAGSKHRRTTQSMHLVLGQLYGSPTLAWEIPMWRIDAYRAGEIPTLAE
jgi:hypothetical protein